MMYVPQSGDVIDSNVPQVLLYNFFKDSTASASQWRLIMKNGSNDKPAPDFDETKHASLCTEVSPWAISRSINTKPQDVAEVSLRRHYACAKESVVLGQL